MKVKLLQDSRREGKAGEIVEVSPARAEFLLRYGMADPVTVREQIETPEKRTAKKKPEEKIEEKIEEPEARTEKKTTRRKK